MNICVVTNDMRLARFIILELEEAGYAAVCSENAENADLYICDLDFVEKAPADCIGFSYDESRADSVSTFLQRPLDAKKLRSAVSKKLDIIPKSNRPLQLEINSATREARTELGKVRLSDKELSLLNTLYKAEILTREGGARIFGAADSNIVDVYVHYLRKKLAKVYSGDTVKSVRGKGYALSKTLDIKFT